MTDNYDNDPPSRPISVAELLAKNGSIGAPPPATGRRRRRRGDTDAVTVAELTGEIPLISDDQDSDLGARDTGTHEIEADTGVTPAVNGNSSIESAQQPDTRRQADTGVAPTDPSRPVRSPERSRPATTPRRTVERERLPHAFEPTPVRRSSDSARAPHAFDPRPSSSRTPIPAREVPPREDDTDIRPYRSEDLDDAGYSDGAEGMSFDPVVDEAEADFDTADADFAAADSDFVGDDLDRVDDGERADDDGDSRYGRGQDTLFGGQSFADDVARGGPLDDPTMDPEIDFDESEAKPGTSLLHYGLIVGQSVLAVIFGAGMFLAFDKLWQWKPIVALVLSVLVILGLVVGVRVVRKTEDIASTLIAVAVGLLVCLGPLALLR